MPKKKKDLKEFHHPELILRVQELYNLRATRKILEQQEESIKEQLAPIVDELPTADGYLLGGLQLQVQRRKGRETIDRVLLLEQGVEPEKVDAATKTGKGSVVYSITEREDEGEG